MFVAMTRKQLPRTHYSCCNVSPLTIPLALDKKFQQSENSSKTPVPAENVHKFVSPDEDDAVVPNPDPAEKEQQDEEEQQQ